MAVLLAAGVARAQPTTPSGAAAGRDASPQAVPTGTPGSLARLAATVDYVAADYAGAVKNGEIVAAQEYREQQQMVGEALSLAKEVRPLTGHADAHDALF